MAGNQIVLTITGTQNEDGTMAIQVTGPIDNLMLFYGMIEIAKDLVRNRHTPQILPANHIPPQLRPGGLR